jgi:hypothetical protein
MKKLILVAGIALFAVSCDNKDDKSGDKGSDSTKMTTSSIEKLDFPYALSEPYKDWQPGNQVHAVNLMKCLKAWQDNKMTESISYFGDSVDLRFDNFQKKVSHDSLTSILGGSRNQYNNIDIKMEDWESVVSKDGKHEWVTMWYKQITTDKKGKTDSADVINDAKFVNGKIVILDEYLQHLAPKK